MVDRLVVHRFRGIKEGVLEDLGKINVLVGPNNSGKTAILELLYLGGVSGRPAQLILEDVPFNENKIEPVIKAAVPMRHDFLGVEPMPRLRKRHGHKSRWEKNPAVLTPEGGIAVNLEGLVRNSAFRSFKLVPFQEEWGEKESQNFLQEDIVEIASLSINEEHNIPKILIPSLFEKWGVLSEQSCWNYLWDPIWVYRWEQQEFIDHFAIWAEEGMRPDAKHVLFFDFHNANDHFEERFAQWAKNHIINWEDKISERMKNVFPTLEGAYIRVDNAPEEINGETGYIQFPKRVRLPVDLFGDGMRHSFKVLASLCALGDLVDDEHIGLFLWEDPELFMHPDALKRLLKEIIDLVRDKPIQVFLSTQSIETIMLLTHSLMESFPEMQSELRIFRMKIENGQLFAAKYKYENVLAWLKQGRDLRSWKKLNMPYTYRFILPKDYSEEETK